MAITHSIHASVGVRTKRSPQIKVDMIHIKDLIFLAVVLNYVKLMSRRLFLAKSTSSISIKSLLCVDHPKIPSKQPAHTTYAKPF